MISALPPSPTAEDYMAIAQAFNPNKHSLTVEKLKSFPGCEHYTDQEATEIIQTIELLTSLLFEYSSKQGKVVYLEETQPMHQLYPLTKNKVA